MTYFYDTNILLNCNLDSLEIPFYLSSVTLQELEDIKTSGKKTEEIRFKARKATRWLQNNEDKYICVPRTNQTDYVCESYNLDPYTPDNQIMSCARLLADEKNGLVFITNDIACYNIAKQVFKLNTKRFLQESDDYRGYKEIILNTEDMAKFYESDKRNNTYDLLINEYIIIKNKEDEAIDAWKWTGEELVNVSNKGYKSQWFGNITYKDIYQKCALDMMFSTQLCLFKGKAGSGKSLLALSYLFYLLEKRKIDKIIIFCNTTKVRGAEQLGFYKGDKNDKLLQGQIGSFLSSKLGDKLGVEMLMQKGLLELLPMSDIRGYDTSGIKAGIYITEAQNTSRDLMKLALQRIGEDCITFIDGDYTSQVDNCLYEGENNGMLATSQCFRGEKIYAEIQFENIYRSKIANIADRM